MSDDPLATTPTEPTEDPFAEVESEALPPGVEQGSLGGDNPSVDTPEPVPEDPPQGEFLEAPDERDDDDLPPTDDVPAAPDEEDERPHGEGEAPEPEEETAADPPEPTPLPEPPAEPDPIAAVGQDAAPGGEESDPPTAVEGSEDPPETPPEPPETPEPEKPKAPRRRRTRRPKNKDIRAYVILRENGPGTWDEAFERTGPKKDKLHTIDGRNGDAALAVAHRKLTDNAPGNPMVLIAVPASQFVPKPVEGQEDKRPVRVKIGK